MEKPKTAPKQPKKVVAIPKPVEDEVRAFSALNGIEIAILTPTIAQQILAIKKKIQDLALRNKIKMSPERRKETLLIAEAQIERVIRIVSGVAGLSVAGMKPQDLRKLVIEVVLEAVENVIERN